MESSIDAREFRTALGCFATGVTVVTARSADGENCGMTASSFNSVSMDPPLVLWSVTKTALSADVFRQAERYAIHVLGSEQQGIASQFATRGIDKFEGVSYGHDQHGVPVLEEHAVRFDCKQWAVYAGGDHWIIVGEVTGIERCNKEVLVFCEGSFATPNPIRTALAEEQSMEEPESPVDRLLLYNIARAYHQMSNQFHAGVRDSGLSIPQWRILASLYGQVSRTRQDLQDRTFLDRESLHDCLAQLEKSRLCVVSAENNTVSGTEAGHERVRHLFELGQAQERDAVGGKSLDELIDHLAEIVKNT